MYPAMESDVGIVASESWV